MTADEIRAQRFRAQLLLGLNAEEVSAFLEDVADAYDAIQQTNRELSTRVKRLEAEFQTRTQERPAVPPPDVFRAETQPEPMSNAAKDRETPAASHIEMLRAAALQEVEALLHDARTQAQALIDGAREREAEVLGEIEAANAHRRREGDDLLAEATARAESLLAAAREEEAAIRSELDRLSQMRLELVDDIRATLDAYQHRLEMVDPRGRAQGRREAAGSPNGGGEAFGSSDEVRAG